MNSEARQNLVWVLVGVLALVWIAWAVTTPIIAAPGLPAPTPWG